MTILRAVVAAILIALMTVTPLSAVLEPGRHETRFPASGAGIAPLPVVVDDWTGLVAGIGLAAPTLHDGVSNPDGDDRVLHISWLGGACDHRVWLIFERADDGFRLAMRTDRAGGCILMAVGRAIEIRLRSRVDAATVAFYGFHD
ncbi:MAG TPA: hypothetical protein VK992_00010 [Candidatus Caenarcaniphilales bacterium]|nr:hypothetical protein [Candidatus Caenarcaniphilales bacterium]